MKKRGQAAMEFLMTYGWAILVVLAAVGALAYFGVLSPSRFIPEKCLMSGSGLQCVDFAANSSGHVTIALVNGGGYDLEDLVVTIVNEAVPLSDDYINLSNNERGIFVAATGETSGSKLQKEFTVTYLNKETGIKHTATGDLVVKIP